MNYFNILLLIFSIAYVLYVWKQRFDNEIKRSYYKPNHIGSRGKPVLTIEYRNGKIKTFCNPARWGNWYNHPIYTKADKQGLIYEWSDKAYPRP